MRGSAGRITKRPTVNRLILPVSISLMVFFTLFATYNLSWYIENRFFHFLLTDGAGFLYGFFLMSAPLFIYPVLYFRGSPPLERVAGSLAIVIGWYVKEFIRISAVYSISQSLYYFLMPVQFGVLFTAIALMSIAEMACRVGAARKGLTDQKAVTPLPVAALVLSVIILVLILNRGGETYFFWFYDLYKFLFF